MHPSVETMWRAFRAGRSDAPALPARPGSVWHFCDNEVDANECARLVLEGVKRATSPSLWSFRSRAEPLPEVGDLHVVTDWAGEARCVIQTTEVEVVPFDRVTAEHAAAEGEGDRSLEWWRRVHWEYYQRELAGTEFRPRGDMPVVCERFSLVFPRP